MCMSLKIKCWMGNQHLARWPCLSGTQRQSRETTSGPSPAARTSILYFNRKQSRVVSGLLAGHNTLSRMELTNSPLCRRCGPEDETSPHILYECEALASLNMYIWALFLNPEDIKSLSMGPSGTLAKEQSSPELVSDYGVQRDRF